MTNGHGPAPGGPVATGADHSNYRWIALSTVTLGTLMVFINQSIVLISLPAIFRGINLNPLTPGNTSYMLWMLMGFMVVLAVLVVSLGRVGDMFGRVKIFNLGFAVFTTFSILLAVTWLSGTSAAIWLIVMRVGQGVGGAMLFANSSAIITDAFPADKRGLGLGINNVAAVAGSFIGLVLGGLLAPVEWHLVFLISVPFGVAGTLWAYVKLEDRGVRTPAKIDWLGNSTFAAGLILVLVGITYGLLPYGGHTMGWTSPMVLGAIFGGLAILVAFGIIETKVAHPMFRLSLFRIRAFSAGNVASFMASLSRGGLMFMLVIWLQGIWLPLHGYSFSQTPLWAGIYMIPLTVGLLAGRTGERCAGRPLRRAAVRHGWARARRPYLHRADHAAGRLPLPRVRRPDLLQLHRHGHVHRAEPDRHHEQPPGQPARRRGRHGRYLQLVGPSALHRHLLHADDPRAGGHAAVRALPRAHRPGGQPGGGHEGLPPASRRQPLRRLPRLQPDTDPPGRQRTPPSVAGYRAVPDQPRVLPAPHRAGLLERVDGGLLVRRRRLHSRRVRFAAAGRQVPLRGGRRGPARDGRGGARWRTGCRRRRPSPRPTRCWWTEMPVSTPRKTTPGSGPAEPAADCAAAPDTPAEAGIRISDAATRVGVSPRTLRYYEELGLLTPSLYTAGGERRYTPDDLAHLERILELREVLGMNLDEIREFLSLETRLDELRATYRAAKGATTQEGASRAEGHAGRGARAQRVVGAADQRQARRAWTASGPSCVHDAQRCRELLTELE